MTNLQQALLNSRNGNAILFCGAGFTADCLNFDEDPALGVTFHLLEIINAELKNNGKQSGFRDIKNATKRFKTEIGSFRLMEILRSRFYISKISSSIESIMEFPWTSIYTTNYDNGIEIGLQKSRKKHTPLNNLDDPNIPNSGTPVVHLHGFAEAWTSNNFEQSCILDADSYRHLSGVSNWMERLRSDIERAEIVVFLGFSAADFHLSQVFFNATGLQAKAFFINRPTASPDPDEHATQEEFGEVLYIGREAFADQIQHILKQDVPKEPRLASFERFVLPEATSPVPPVAAIEDLLIWGNVDRSHIKRDWDVRKSDYHVLRGETVRIVEHLRTRGNIAFVHGDICDGKSLAILGAQTQIASGRPVFQLRHSYSDLLNEVSSIFASYPNAVLVVEGCFTLREERLTALVRQVSASDGGMILSARSIATEAESDKLRAIRTIQSVADVRLGRMQSSEVDSLISLIDQIAGWREFHALTFSDRQRFIERDCGGILPSVLLRLLKSKYVQNAYLAEYNKISGLDLNDKRMVIAALIIAGIGFDAPTSFLSEAFEKDCVSTIRRISSDVSGLKLVHADGNFVKTIPSIGARNIASYIIEDSEIVNTTIHLLNYIRSKFRRSEFENYLFSQLMRYSILSSIISDEGEVNRFFDNISKISYFRELPLFWLQWHMAMSAQKSWLKAEDYLKMGYTAADAYDKKRAEKYNRKQLEDRKAKFFATRAMATSREGVELFRDMKEATEIVGRLMRDAQLTHHPYETLLQIVQVMEAKGLTIPKNLGKILVRQLKDIVDRSATRVGVVPEGYQRNHATSAMQQIEPIAALFR